MNIVDMNQCGLPLLVLVLIIGVLAIYCRREIRDAIPRLTNLTMKKGDAELTIQKDAIAEAIPPSPNEPEQTPPSERVEEKPDNKGALDPTGIDEPDEFTRLKIELFDALKAKDGQTVTRILARLDDQDIDRDEKTRITALTYSLQYRYGDPAALSKLQALTQKHEGGSPYVLSHIYTYLGEAYSQAESYNYAMKAYEQAALLTPEPEKATLLVSVAHSIYHSGQKEEAVDRLITEITGTESPSAKSILLKGLAWIYEQEKDLALRAVALEKALQCDPSDFELHFNSAWSYGDLDVHTLPLVHYRTYLQFDEESPNALNNLGVEYDRLGLPIHAVSKYTAASERGNTLATANLAYQYIDAGFVQDAKHLINKAKQVEDVHPNIGRALSAISVGEEAEDDTEEGILKTAREQQRFVLSFADAYFTKISTQAVFAGKWQLDDSDDEDEVVTITAEGSQLVIGWSYGSREHQIRAKASNRGAVITSYQIESSYSTEKGADVGYMYLTPDGTKLLIMAMKNDYSVYTKARTTKTTYWTLTRI